MVFEPGRPLVTSGPFRWLRHPNYLAVIVEFIALPMVHAAWLTAIGFSVANGLVLRHRIRVEEAALAGVRDDVHVSGAQTELIPGRR